jgi:hypothetical protein
MSHKAAKIARKAMQLGGPINSENKFMVIDQARIDHPKFYDTYTESLEDAEQRARDCNGKVEVWTLLRVVPDTAPAKEDKP